MDDRTRRLEDHDHVLLIRLGAVGDVLRTLPALHLNRVERNLLIAEAIGARGDTIEMILPERPDEGRAAEDLLRSLNPRGLPVVVLSPGTSRRQRHKRWPAEHFSGLAGRLASDAGV